MIRTSPPRGITIVVQVVSVVLARVVISGLLPLLLLVQFMLLVLEMHLLLYPHLKLILGLLGSLFAASKNLHIFVTVFLFFYLYHLR